MSDAERRKLVYKLDEFSRRLDAHVRDLTERGQITDAHRKIKEEMARRQDEMRRKIAAAQAEGTSWDLIKSEAERDFNSLFDALLDLNERLDADQMKG